MGKRSGRQQLAYLPLVLCATFLVTVCPVLLVWWLRDSGAVTSAWVGTGLGVAVSFGVSSAGAALWKARTGSRDVLFGELMLWGWVQRWRAERRLATASDVLGLNNGPRQNLSGGRLTHEQRAGLLTQLASALEARDPYTHGHSRRVARHAANIAKRMGLSAEEVARVRTAGVVHDVGKVNTPTWVLHKEGQLTDGEYTVVKRHPVQGAALVSPLGDEELSAMVRHHHERLDGTGYPSGLAGDFIPLGARILAVADTFDAITSTRPYRRAHAHKKAIAILTAEAGAQLDPDVVRAFHSYYTGSRPLVLWAILVNGPPRLASWLGGGLGTAKASSVGNVMATAAATAVVGGAAVAPLVDAPARSHQAPQAATAPDTTPAARQRAVSTSAAGDEGARPVGARAQDKVEGPGRKAASPGGWRGHRKARGGNPTTPHGAVQALGGGGNTAPSGGGVAPNAVPDGSDIAPGVVPDRGKIRAELKNHANGKIRAKRKATAKGMIRAKRKTTAPGRGRAHDKRNRGRAHHEDKRRGGDAPTTPRDKKTAPADAERPAGQPHGQVKPTGPHEPAIGLPSLPFRP